MNPFGLAWWAPAAVLVASSMQPHKDVRMPKASTARSISSGTSPHAIRGFGEVIETTLGNGLKIRLAPNSNVPTVSYYTFFRVGSRNERPGITGISHLFEHMMFNGTKRYGPGQFDRVLESNGGTSNAYTSHDLTVYHDDVAAEALEQVIDLESDRMRSLTISDRMLETERQVVLEERRMRVDNEIAGLLDEELGTLVFKAHPYRWPIIGWQKDIEAITKRECMDYFRTYYAPNNATVFVVGDFEPGPTMKLLKKYYGSIPKGPLPPTVLNAEPDQKGERRAEVHFPSQAPQVWVAYRAPDAQSNDTLTLDVLQYVLGVGHTGRLTRALVYEKEQAVSVHVDWSWRLDPGAILFALELKPGSDPGEAEKALELELAEMARTGPTQLELQKAKNNLRAHLIRELATNSGRANAMGTYEALLGSWKAGLELPARYERISAEQVQTAARKYFTSHNRSVVTLVPTAAERD